MLDFPETYFVFCKYPTLQNIKETGINKDQLIKGKVLRSGIEEVSALEATFVTGLAFGFWKDKEEIKSLKNIVKTFIPGKSSSEIGELYKGWKKAVERTRLV
jgi:glycerol kinase